MITEVMRDYDFRGLGVWTVRHASVNIERCSAAEQKDNFYQQPMVLRMQTFVEKVYFLEIDYKVARLDSIIDLLNRFVTGLRMSSPTAFDEKAFFQGPSGSVVSESPSETVELLPIMIKAFKMAGIAVAVWVWGYLGFSVAWIFVALFFHVASVECRKSKESKKAYAMQAVLNEREAILSRVDDHSSWVSGH